MINPTTLILATLVFNAASVFGAPIRISTSSSEVVARAAVADPILPRVVVADVQPEIKRSVESAEYDTRDTASLPEVDTIVRRYPRGVLYNFYEKRTPEPAPAPSAEETPADDTLHRRFPRRAAYDLYVKRSEPVQEETRSEQPEPEVARRFPRRSIAERYSAAAEAPVSREPAPEPAPQPRRFARRALAEEFEKRQDPTSTTTSSTTTVSAPSATATLTTTSNAPGLSIDNAIAAAISQGINNPGNVKSTTHVQIIINHEGTNKDTPPAGAATKPAPTSTSAPTSTASPAKATSTGAPVKAGSDATTGTSTPTSSSPSPVDGEKKLVEEPTGGAAAAAPSPAATDKPTDAPESEGDSRRDLGEDAVTPAPLARRSGGLSGAVWATWNKRSSP